MSYVASSAPTPSHPGDTDTGWKLRQADGGRYKQAYAHSQPYPDSNSDELLCSPRSLGFREAKARLGKRAMRYTSWIGGKLVVMQRSRAKELVRLSPRFRC